MFNAFLPLSVIILLLVGMLLLLSVYTDIRSRLIPNWLVGAVLLLGLVHLGLNIQSASSYLISLAIGLVVWSVLFYAKVLGGGDAKLMMALSLFVLPSDLLMLYACVLIAGGLQAGIWMIFKKETHMPYAVAIAVGSLIYYGA